MTVSPRAIVRSTTLALLLALPGARLVAEDKKPTPTPEAPFGLTWLAPKNSLIEQGIRAESVPMTVFGDSYLVSTLPKELADLHYAVLSYGDEDRLIRITAVGGKFVDDHDASQVLARYAELQRLLKAKYGKGKTTRKIGKGFSDTRVALGLQVGKNSIYTVYAPPGMRVELSVISEAGAQTRWRIIFEHLAGLERFESRRKKADREAL